MHILVLNVGSSSVKFQLIDTDESAIAAAKDRRLARGQIERIGGEAIVTLSANDQRPGPTDLIVRHELYRYDGPLLMVLKSFTLSSEFPIRTYNAAAGAGPTRLEASATGEDDHEVFAEVRRYFGLPDAKALVPATPKRHAFSSGLR